MTWDFLHPGLDAHGHVDLHVGDHHIGHSEADHFGNAHHFDMSGVEHGQTHLDLFGDAHHSQGGIEHSLTHTDLFGHAHTYDSAGISLGHSMLDSFGIGHRLDASGHELWQSTVDHSGAHFRGADHALGSSPPDFLDALLRSRSR